MARKYTVTLDFAALWETTNALVIRRRSLEALVPRTKDPSALRVLAGTLGHLEDAERVMRAVLDVPEPIPAGEAPGVYTEAYGR